LGSLPGVIRTRVGYTGGTTQDPTYYNLGDHTETVEIDFDPARVSYQTLVEEFFKAHDATRSAKRQYMSAIFTYDAEQERVARDVLQRVQAATDRTVQPQVLPAEPFYLAEDYHQKYALRGNRLLFAEFEAMYPDFQDLVDSAAASRVNAYLYGFGTAEQLTAELDKLGLSERGKEALVKAGPTGICPVP